MRISLLFAVILGVLGAVPAHAQNSSASKIEVVEAWSRSSEGKAFTNAYVEVINTANVKDTLLSVSSPWAQRAYFAHYVHNGYDMKLTPVSTLQLRAKRRLKLDPSGHFIRLEDLTQEIRPGMSIPITLRFANGGVVEIEAKVGNQKLGNMDR
ncbi:MAG: copper chaperone PCu(A)C [Rhodospirillaceae bacterium]|nr:copper chaperone PCu(A)C [Rhodospirillaceae bacterium]